VFGSCVWLWTSVCINCSLDQKSSCQLLQKDFVPLSFLLFSYMLYSEASVHERPCSRTIRFTNKFSEQKTSRMTNGLSDYEHASWQKRQIESISAGVSCWLTLAQYTSLLDFGLRTFRFTNGLHERIKFVNRGPTVLAFLICCLKGGRG
jgi:hypothetical protein